MDAISDNSAVFDAIHFRNVYARWISERKSKSKIRHLIVSFRNKHRLTYQVALQIARGELPPENIYRYMR